MAFLICSLLTLLFVRFAIGLRDAKKKPTPFQTETGGQGRTLFSGGA